MTLPQVAASMRPDGMLAMACNTGTPRLTASRFARPPSTFVNGVRKPAANQIVVSLIVVVLYELGSRDDFVT
jgi:hypothetical protein